jgi:hypothetical protein
MSTSLAGSPLKEFTQDKQDQNAGPEDAGAGGRNGKLQNSLTQLNEGHQPRPQEKSDMCGRKNACGA